MPVTTGTYKTPHAARYAAQLCKHFAHELEVVETDTGGAVHFAMGVAHVSANNQILTVRFDLHNDDAFEAAQAVIDDHLARFAFREGFAHMAWDWAPPITPKRLFWATMDTTKTRFPKTYAAARRLVRRTR